MSQYPNADQDWIKSAVYAEPIDSYTKPADTTAVQLHKDTELPLLRKRQSFADQADYTQDTNYLEQEDEKSSTERRRIVKSFKFTSPTFGNNITVTESSKWSPEPAYFAVSRECKLKGPDIILHKGGSRTGEQLGLAQFSTFSRHIKLGFGNESETADTTVWEDMKNTGSCWGHSKYEFEVNVPDADSDFVWDIDDKCSGTRRKLNWIKTRDERDGIEGWNTKWSCRNYRCVDVSSGCVLAVMSAKALRRCTDKGDLKLHQQMSTDLELAIVLSAVSICEKAERREGISSYGMTRLDLVH